MHLTRAGQRPPDSDFYDTTFANNQWSKKDILRGMNWRYDRYKAVEDFILQRLSPYLNYGLSAADFLQYQYPTEDLSDSIDEEFPEFLYTNKTIPNFWKDKAKDGMLLSAVTKFWNKKFGAMSFNAIKAWIDAIKLSLGPPPSIATGIYEIVVRSDAQKYMQEIVPVCDLTRGVVPDIDYHGRLIIP